MMETKPNHPPPLRSPSFFTDDPALMCAVQAFGAGWAGDALAEWGANLASGHWQGDAILANRNKPEIQLVDRYGNRRDAVQFHPAYHNLMRRGCQQGLHTKPWVDPAAGAHVARGAGFYLFGQLENGTQCPITMTFGAIPVLREDPLFQPGGLFADWIPKLLACDYDPHFLPASRKTALTIGMGMTERSGGSDVSMNESCAEQQADGSYTLHGHKWFFSAPMCDGFLVLAQAKGGLSCFFLPRFLPDGQQNDLRLIRLKDKLGNHSNASAEVEFNSTRVWLLGEEGRGVPLIIRMAASTRLDCALGSAGIMRAAMREALHYIRHRKAFGKVLIEQPLMQNLAADLLIETEAAMWLALWLASLFEHDSAEQQALRRLLTPVAKYHITKRCMAVTGEAMEMLGGGGYIEDNSLPRWYREAPVNSIWEGSGNVMCLDVLRSLHKEPLAFEAFHALFADQDLPQALSALLESLEALLRSPTESQARAITESMALAVQAWLLHRHAEPEIATLFIQTRLAPQSGNSLGRLPAGSDFGSLIHKMMPKCA